MKTKRIRLVAAVALILLATIIGAVTSTLQAKATDPENNATSYSVADVYKAKYYSMLMAYCMSVPININNSTYLPMGDADDQLTLENAWAGVFGGDSDENWYTAKKDLFPATDTLLGSGRLQCDSKGFGEDRNEGLIAAWIDSLAKISNLPSTTSGKYALDVKKRFSQLSNQEKSAIFSLLNFVPRDENGSDKRITSSGKKDDTSPKDGGVDAQDILYALDILNGYTDKGEKEDVSLVIRNLTGDQGKTSDRDYNISKAIKDVQKVARRYHADIVIDSLTDEEKYTQYYLAYSGRCSDYNDNNSYEVNDTYTYLAIKTPPESPTPKLVKETFKIPRSINNLDYSNFLNFDTFASTVQTATKKDPYTDRISCRADSSFEYNMLARNIFREKYAGQIYSECAAYYDNEFKKKQSELTSLKGRLSENLVSEQATIYTSFGVDQANVLKFTDTKTSNDYANCKMGYSLAGGGSNVDPTTRSKGPYECNKRYLKRYYDQYTAETEAVEKVSFGDLQYQQCYDHYDDGNPMAITSADYVFDEQEEDFTRDYKKYKCGIELISRLSDADKESIRGDKTQLAQYNKLVSLTEIYKSLDSFMDAKEDLESVREQYNDNSAYLDSALDGLISSDIIINAAAAGRVDGRNPKLGIINQILIGINDYSDEMEMGCGADDYINASLPEDLESRTGISRNTSGYQGSELQGLAGKDDSSHGDDPFPDGISVSTCEGNALMGWILCPIIEGVTGGASKLYHSAIEGSLQMNSDELAANNTGAHQAWGYFVNFANVILIILFLFVIFSQLTGYGIDNYGIKRVLPKLIIVAILINLSFIICQLAVDVTNILGHSFESLFDSITVAKNASIENNEILDKILGWLLGGIGLGVTIAAGVYTVKNVRNLLTGLLIPVLLAILVALIAVLFFFILLGVRRAGIIALIVVSPVAIVCYALPNTKKYFDKWFNGLKALLVVYPVCGLMLGMSRLIARLISAGNEDFISNLVAMAVLVYPFFVIPTLVSRAISTVTSLGEKISQLGRGIRKKTSDGIKNTERYKEAQERRKAAEEARRGTRRAAIDARRRARTGQPDGAATQSAEAARRDAIRTLSDPNASLADRRRAQRELRRADRALAAAQWYQKSEDNYLAKQKEAQETAARAGYQGDYVATMDASQGRAIQNAFNIKIADAEQLAREVNIDLARDRATARHQSEEYKAYQEQFSQYDKEGLEKAAKEALADFKDGRGDINKVQAAFDLLQKNGYTEESLGAYFNMDAAAWSSIREDKSARSTLISQMGKSGNVLQKGYSKYLAMAGENAVSFKDWLKEGDKTTELTQKAGETDSEFTERKEKFNSLRNLEEYKKATFTNNDMLVNADKDTLKFVSKGLESGALGNAITADDLSKAATAKSGEELTVVNKAISSMLDKSNTTAYQNSVSKFKFTNENFGAIKDSTWQTLVGDDKGNIDPAFMQAFVDANRSQLMDVQMDKRIWNKVPEKYRMAIASMLGGQSGNPPQPTQQPQPQPTQQPQPQSQPQPQPTQQPQPQSNPGSMNNRSTNDYDGDEYGF